MTSEFNIGVLALTVSLIALLIAVTQASVQLFSTAEGYRKCARHVIGPWSSKRHRKWLWAEFRLQTTYVTPHIAVFTPEDRSHAPSEVCLLSSEDRRKFPEVELTIHPDWRVNTSTSLCGIPEKQEDVEKHTLQRHTSSGGLPGSSMVTWVSMLRELHMAYMRYWPDEHCYIERIPKSSLGKPRRNLYDSEDSPHLNLNSTDSKVPVHHNESSTDAGAIYRTWNWDFTPDTMRPLATSTVGDIVVFALRLGMEWTVLDPGRGNMQASGNGYSLTATDIQPLGLVLNFSATGNHGNMPCLVPSRAADKLMCGILPGCPHLVRRDFRIIGRDRQLLRGDILEQIGLTHDVRARIEEQDSRMSDAHVITLLCTFLPQRRSSSAAHYCWYWREQSPFSVFHWWEGRLALLRGLQSYVAKLDASQSSVVQEILSHFITLSKDRYEGDFDSRVTDSNIPLGQDRPVNDMGLIEGLRNIFDWTTEYFKQAGFHEVRATGRTKYLRLVAAHLRMINGSIQHTDEMIAKQKAANMDFTPPALWKRYELENVPYHLFIHTMYEYGKGFTEHVDHEDFGVVKFFYERSDDMAKADILEAWWMMVLRGIVWGMATIGRAGPGEAVPPHLYRSHTPVWIT